MGLSAHNLGGETRVFGKEAEDLNVLIVESVAAERLGIKDA